jgi:hypothetical protein
MRPNAAVGTAGAVMPSSGSRRARPIDASVGIVMGAAAAMWPSVLLPSSPYTPASGNSPMPTLSRTITMARSNTPQGWCDEK